MKNRWPPAERRDLQFPLGDGHHDRNLRGFRVVQGFHRLGHHAFTGRDDQDDNIGHVRAASTHRTESGMAWRVEERQLLEVGGALGVRHLDGVRANMLGDTPGLPRRDIRFPDHVQKSRLPMIDMAHDGDHRRPGLQVLELVLVVQFDLPDRCVHLTRALFPALRLEPETVPRGQKASDLLVDGLIQVCEDVQLHQVMEDLVRLHTKLLGKVPHDNRRFDADDFASHRSDEIRKHRALRRTRRRLRSRRRSLLRRGPAGVSLRSVTGRAAGSRLEPLLR